MTTSESITAAIVACSKFVLFYATNASFIKTKENFQVQVCIFHREDMFIVFTGRGEQRKGQRKLIVPFSCLKQFQ